MLDERAKTIETWDATGKRLRSIPFRGQGYELGEPTDVVVDPALNTYVADKKSGTIAIFGRDGALLTSLGRSDLREPIALTLEPSGAVLVYDDKERQILRFD